MIFVETGKVLIDKKTGAKFKIVKLNGEEGVKSVEFWGGVTSCNDPMVYLDQLVLENFIIEDEEKMTNIKVGKKIVKYLEDCVANNRIESYEVKEDKLTLIDITIRVNEDFAMCVFPEVNDNDRILYWETRTIVRGNENYYADDRTQDAVCETLEERINHYNIVYSNKLKEKYKDAPVDTLISVLVHRDKEIIRLQKEIEELNKKVKKIGCNL